MVTPLRVLFYGTPAFAEHSLRAIQASDHTVAAVITQPDRPRGRGHKVAPGPVKTFAVEHGLPVLQPGRIKDAPFVEAVRSHGVDLAVVAAYGKILPQALIDVPRLGTINVHASLLPRWRGAAPVHRAILAGDAETGVTIMRVVQALDAGPMLARVRLAIGADETATELEARLAAAGATLLVETLDRLAAGPVAEDPQPDEGVTYAARLERAESRVEWARPAIEVHNHIRGLQPWPLAVFVLRGRRLALLESIVEPAAPVAGAPGDVLAAGPDGIVVLAGDGAVRITRVQLEGRPAMAVRQFLNGHRVAPGDRLEPLAAGA